MNLKILSIDTSCNTCRVALYENGKILGNFSECDKKTHSVKLLPAIENILKENGMEPADIDLLGVTNGPGSYTGMRIGVSTAKAIAFGICAPLVGINTLDFLAKSALEDENACEADKICSLINARNERVYSCIYDKNSKRLRECTAGELADVLKEFSGEKVLFTGDGSVDYAETIRNVMGENAMFAGENTVLGKSGVLCEMTKEIYEKEENKDNFTAEKLVIDYLRSYLQEK